MNRGGTAKKLYVNLYRINMVDFITSKSPQYALGIGYDEKYIKGSVNTKFPVLQIDNRLNWKNHTEKNIPTLYGSPYAVR